MMPNMMQSRQSPGVGAQYQQQAYEQVQAHYEQQVHQQQQQFENVQQHYDQSQQQYNHLQQYDQTQSQQTQFDAATIPAQQFDAQYTSALDAAAEEFVLPSQQEGTVNKTTAKRKGAFRAEHAIKYGLQVVGSTLPVTKVQCLFCVHYGREMSADDTKRKMNVKGIKFWTPPFRTDHYAMHHDLQHKIMFQHYENSSAQERLHFFEPDTVHRLRNMAPRANRGADNAKLRDNRQTKRAKGTTARVDPNPSKNSLDPFKMMLPPTEIPHDMQTLVDIYVGHNYVPLEEKWKSLTTIASLVAQHVRNGFLETHIRRALLSGASKSEIVQVIMQSASFIGLPKTMDAMKVAHDVFLQGHPDTQNQNPVFL